MIDEIYQGLTDDEKIDILLFEEVLESLENAAQEVLDSGWETSHPQFDSIVSSIMAIKFGIAVREIKKLRGMH